MRSKEIANDQEKRKVLEKKLSDFSNRQKTKETTRRAFHSLAMSRSRTAVLLLALVTLFAREVDGTWLHAESPKIQVLKTYIGRDGRLYYKVDTGGKSEFQSAKLFPYYYLTFSRCILPMLLTFLEEPFIYFCFSTSFSV